MPIVGGYRALVVSSKRTNDLDPNGPPAATVFFYETELESSAFLGRAFFYPDGTPLKNPTVSGGTIDLYFNLSQFGSVLQLLREERPVSLTATDLQTGREPVGEEEGRALAESEEVAADRPASRADRS